MGFGYKVTSQPSANKPAPVGSAGLGRITLQAQAAAVGSYLNAADGVLIGTGINPGTPMTTFSDGEVGIGSGNNVAAIRITRLCVPGVRSKLGLNFLKIVSFQIRRRFTWRRYLSCYQGPLARRVLFDCIVYWFLNIQMRNYTRCMTSHKHRQQVNYRSYHMR